MAEQTEPRQGFKQSSTAKNTERKYSYQLFNGMMYREDGEPMTEADWDSITTKVISIVTSHGLVFRGKTTPQGKVEEEEKKESSLILPPEK